MNNKILCLSFGLVSVTHGLSHSLLSINRHNKVLGRWQSASFKIKHRLYTSRRAQSNENKIVAACHTVAKLWLEVKKHYLMKSMIKHWIINISFVFKFVNPCFS